MKEFIEKLFERLEGESYLTTNDDGETNKFSVQVVEWKDIKKIVNQLAEEYKNESVKGDLISRSELLKELESNKLQPTKDTDGFIDGWCEGFNTVVDMIRNQPTAFDTEKVVEQLVCNSRFVDDINEHNIKCISCVIGQKTAIDIVKKGGVE